jgi:hypothetical protein
MIGKLRMKIIIYLCDITDVSATGIVAINLESSLKILDVNKYMK